MIQNSIWTEKYRPQNLDEYIGNDDVKKKIKNWLDQGDVPSLLLYGSAGGGKTSLAKLIAKHLDADVMYINASDENSVDVIRDKINGFASTIGFSQWKIVILDECLKYDTLIHIIRDGIQCKIPINELNEETDKILSFNIDTNIEEISDFKKKNNGLRKIFKIELENGQIIECTGNHKWYVQNSNGEIEVVMTIDLHKYNHILSPFAEK